ncbi:MAG: hypothetical protein GSR79_05465 [Desulfurococcales archaeon]|nr:hypothetical protein [Desulfurococcales archaeon]
MEEKLTNLMNILEEEFGDSIVYECRNDICIVNLLFFNKNLIIRLVQEDFLRVETERIEQKQGKEFPDIPMVKASKNLEGVRLTCDLPLSCIENKKAFKSCVSTVIQGLFAIDDDLSRKLFDSVLSLVRELNVKGLTGSEIYNVLVNQYKVPGDIAETVIESYYAFIDED